MEGEDRNVSVPNNDNDDDHRVEIGDGDAPGDGAKAPEAWAHEESLPKKKKEKSAAAGGRDDDGVGSDQPDDFEGDSEAEVDASLQAAILLALQGSEDREGQESSASVGGSTGRSSPGGSTTPSGIPEHPSGGGAATVVREIRIEKRYDPSKGKWKARIERNRDASSSVAMLSGRRRPRSEGGGHGGEIDNNDDNDSAHKLIRDVARARRELRSQKQPSPNSKAERPRVAAMDLDDGDDVETGVNRVDLAMEATTAHPLEELLPAETARPGAFRMGGGDLRQDEGEIHSDDDDEAGGARTFDAAPPPPSPTTAARHQSLQHSVLAASQQRSESILLEANLVEEQADTSGGGGGPLVKAEPIRRKRQALAVAALVVLTALVVGVTTGVVLSRPDPPPTPDYEFVNVSSMQASFNASLSSSTTDAIQRGATPQAEAYHWLFATSDHPDLPESEAVPRLLHRFALVTLFYATGGNDSWTLNTGWLDPMQHECLWYGVACPNGTSDALGSCANKFGIPSVSCHIRTDARMIEGLELSGNGLQRSLPREIGLLGESGITRIKLEGNNLEGSIPSEIQYLTTLQMVSLIRNNFDGTLPTAIGALSNLEKLLLSQNELTGTIPASLSNLVALKDLDLGQNRFTGQMPTEIGLLTALVNLVASGNALTGALPSELAGLTRLEKVDVSDNEIEISFADGVGTAMSSLKVLALGENSGPFPASIPTQIGEFVSLTRLELFSNSMEGSIPTELGRLENLEHLLLNNNELDGTIPTELGNLQNLMVWNTYDNYDISGSLPSELARLAALEQFIVGSCYLLNGTIPSEFGNLTKLRVWDVSDNDLSGVLSSELGQLTALEEFTAWGMFHTCYARQIQPRSAASHACTDVSHSLQAIDYQDRCQPSSHP